MRCRLSILVCATLTACASRSAEPREPAEASGATYAFSANTPHQLIRGTVLVGPEGTGVQFDTPCQREATVRARPTGMPSSTSVLSYYCSGTWLTFDRRNPATAKWYASVEILRRREVCARYETQNGRQVCVSRKMETYTVTESRSGAIQVRRIP